MDESIYTLKLIRRGNVVPEGLQSAFSASARITDLMHHDFAIRESGEPEDPDNEITIFAESGLISKVCGRHWHHNGITGGNTVILPFTVIDYDSTLLDTLQALQHSDAKIALISRKPMQRRTEDVVGVIGLPDISLYFCQQAALL